MTDQSLAFSPSAVLRGSGRAVRIGRMTAAALLACASTLAGAADPDARFVRKLALAEGRTAVVAEGDLEARSIGSYSVRVYASAAPGDDTTFFLTGLIRPRDGTIERIFLADLGRPVQAALVVSIRSAGSGGYRSADAYRIAASRLSLIGAVSGLPPDADPVVALNAVLARRPLR